MMRQQPSKTSPSTPDERGDRIRDARGVAGDRPRRRLIASGLRPIIVGLLAEIGAGKADI
jgi:hypothetical protein